jgi:hypothetical protein
MNSVITSAGKCGGYNSEYKVHKAVIRSKEYRNEKGEMRRECESDAGKDTK